MGDRYKFHWDKLGGNVEINLKKENSVVENNKLIKIKKMELSFDGAEVGSGSKYLEVGNHLVKVTKIEKGVSTGEAKSPYVEITVSNQAGATCAQKYYLNTAVKEGKKQSAWNISSSAILTIITAAHNIDSAAAKTMLSGVNTENIDAKLSSLLIGKQLAIKLNGKRVNPNDMEKKSYVVSEFGSGLFAVPFNDIAKLPTKEYIKGDFDDRAANGGTQASAANALPGQAATW